MGWLTQGGAGGGAELDAQETFIRTKVFFFPVTTAADLPHPLAEEVDIASSLVDTAVDNDDIKCDYKNYLTRASCVVSYREP